jgi:hypothetical protein
LPSDGDLSQFLHGNLSTLPNPALSPPYRDTLLPKLISGELRVKDAERAVAEAAA